MTEYSTNLMTLLNDYIIFCDLSAPTPRTIYSFLSVAWGIVSDADIESERLRALGGARFAVMGLFRIIKLRTYRGRLTYLPAPSAAGGGGGASAAGAAAGTGAASGAPAAEEGGGGSVDRALPAPARSMPPLDDTTALAAAPWVTVEGEFLLLWSMHVSYGASDMLVAPGLRPDDGVMQIMWVMAGAMGKCKLLELMDKLERGEHVGEPGMNAVKVTKYRLEPLDPPPPGCLSVDGELVPYGAMQSELLATQGVLMLAAREEEREEGGGEGEVAAAAAAAVEGKGGSEEGAASAVAAAAVEGAGEGASARVEEAEEAAEEDAPASKAAEKEKEKAADGEAESTTGGAADAAGN